MTFAIIGDRIEIDGLHMATLAPSLIGSPREAFIEMLDAGDCADESFEAHRKELDEQRERLEDEIGEAEDEARAANDRARAAEEEAEGYLEALRAIAFAAGKAGSVSGLDLEQQLLHHPGVPYAIYRVLMAQVAEGQDAARKEKSQ
jgi:hypothetical protein